MSNYTPTNTEWDELQCCLREAIKKGDSILVGHLIKRVLSGSAIVTQYDERGSILQQALFEASAYGHLDIVTLLLQQMTKRKPCDMTSLPFALQTAAGYNHIEIVRLLLKTMITHAQPLLQGALTWALETAAVSGHTEIVTLLLETMIDHKMPLNRGLLNTISNKSRDTEIKTLLQNWPGYVL
jgi:hypothetical protein